jgi:hypothetical protein
VEPNDTLGQWRTFSGIIAKDGSYVPQKSDHCIVLVRQSEDGTNVRILEKKNEIPISDEIILEENENEPRKSTSLLYVLDRINYIPHY